jgi:hypothetical protein
VKGLLADRVLELVQPVLPGFDRIAGGRLGRSHTDQKGMSDENRDTSGRDER